MRISKKGRIGLTLLPVAAVCVGAVFLTRRKVRGAEGKGISKDPMLAAIADGIRKNAPVFDGLYESLYQAQQSTEFFSTDAYEEWCNRVAQIGDAGFRYAFDSHFSKADIADEALCRAKFQLLLDCIHQAGITRDRQRKTPCTADETMQKAYVASDNQKPTVGSLYTVLKAAWFQDGNVLEYGIAMPGTVTL